MVVVDGTDRERSYSADDTEDILNDIKNMNPSFKEILKETLIASADEVKLGGVHIDDWEKTGWAIPIVFFYYAVFLMSFFYFIYTLTLQGMSGRYLSLLPSNADQFCIEIPVTISTSVQGDAYGNWDTNSSFLQNSSLFMLTFSGSKVTNDGYKSIMLQFKDDLRTLSEKSSRRDAAWNAIMWSTFGFSDSVGNMNFYSSADARYLYNGDIRSGFVTSASAGICHNVQQHGKLDDTGNHILFVVPTSPISNGTLNGDFTCDPSINAHCGMADAITGYDIIDTCPEQFPANRWLSWSLSVYTGNLEVGFDLRTISCVMSVNMGITKLSTYIQTSSIYGTVGTGGLPGFFYYYQFYDYMKPFFCVDKQAAHDQGIYKFTKAQLHGPDLCFVVQQTNANDYNGDTLAALLYYPISASLSASTDVVTTDVASLGAVYHCECPKDALDPNCNQKNIVMGLFYDKELATSHFNTKTNAYTETTPTNQIKFALVLQKYLIDDPVNGDLKMQQHFTEFFASGLEVSDDYGYFNFRDQIYLNKTILKQANLPMNTTNGDLHKARWKEICPWGTCGSFVFQISSDETVDAFLPMNNYFYQAGLAPFMNSTFNITTKVGTGPISTFQYNQTKHKIDKFYNPRCDVFNSSTGTCSNSDDVYRMTVLKREMCENTVYNTAVMDSYINFPPVSVIQPYFQCRKTSKAALVDSVGNAAGTAGITSALFMLIAGIFFRKLHNQRAMKHALKIALARKDLELNGEEPGRERDFKQKIAVMTTRESRQIDDTIDSKQMHAVFATLKSVVQLARDQQETLLSQQDTLLHQQHILKHLQMDYIPPSNERKKSERQDPNMIDLQVNMKKLQDIVEFDFNESRLTSLSEKKRMHDEKHTVVQFREEKDDFIPFEY